MNIAELDFQSVVIGYAVGIVLMWSIHTVLFEETIDEEKPKENNLYPNSSVYHGNYPYNLSTSNRE